MLTLNDCNNFYQGKVRDVYTIQDRYMVLVASNRISAFDVILPREIPYKGQVLNQLAAHFLEKTRHIVPNWFLQTIGSQASIGSKATAYPVEMVVRGYLVGHAWRTYNSGLRTLCGVTLPEGLKENQKLPDPIITPTTKAQEGHDMDISRQEIIDQGIIAEEAYTLLENYSLALYTEGARMAEARGLILADTKFEFGNVNGVITLIDEILTPDSSRYFYADTYDELFQADLPQKQLSKEFVREWLMANGFQGKEGQTVPEMSEEFVREISDRYIELYEKVSGISFQRENIDAQSLEKQINEVIQELVL